MGRSLESVRMGAKEVSERRLKASRVLKKEAKFTGRGMLRWPKSTPANIARLIAFMPGRIEEHIN